MLDLEKKKISIKYAPSENKLKVTVNSKDTTSYFNFKKTKWQKLIFYLLLQNRFDNKYYKLFDQNLYNVPLYTNNFSSAFKEYLLIKKQFKVFYGFLKNKNFLKIVKKSQQKGGMNLLNYLESRLDVILVRSNFTLSLKNAQQLISHGYISVNKKLIKTKSFRVKKGDKITVNPTAHKLIEYYILNSLMWPLPPKYLQTDYKIFQIIVIEDIKVVNNFYYFWLNFKSLKNN